MNDLKEKFPFLKETLLGNEIAEYLISLVIFFSIMFLLKIFKSIVLIKLRSLAKKTKNDFDDCLIDVLDSIKPIFYIASSLFISLLFLDLPKLWDNVVWGIFFVIFVSQALIILQRLIDYFVDKFIIKQNNDLSETEKEEEDKNREAVVKLVSRLGKASLWVIGVILVLANLGINVTSLVAGFGIGGIAIGLAVQNILSDVFSSVSIFTDKPFKVGDFIQTGQESGTVKRIGIKTTRISTLTGEELVIPNKDLTESRVHNFKKLKKRRASFSIGVTYETDIKKLKRIPDLIKKAINGIDMLEADRINFKEFGDFSLNYEIVFYVDSPEYADYVNSRELLNLKIMELFQKEEIEFAYPTQSIILSKQ